MIDIRMRHPVAPDDVAIVRALADDAEVADGHSPLGDAIWRDLQAPGDGTSVFLAVDAGKAIGALHTMTRPDGSVTAAAVVHPERREGGVASALLGAAIAALPAQGARHMTLWAFGTDDRSDAFASAAGLVLERELWQMRVALPLAEAPTWPTGITVRPFVPGEDETDWVEVNNRSFAHDPDQGGWTEDHLRRLEAEPWFDPAGFLLAFDDRGLAGFCWTKVHAPMPPHEPNALGEIYVIGVDPDRQGSGLGRALLVAGLACLHARGVNVSMLFVDASNSGAIALYRSSGFEITRIDRAYGRDVA